jgi:hypothetical protein
MCRLISMALFLTVIAGHIAYAQNKSRRLLFIVIPSHQGALSPDFMVPFIEKELFSMTGRDDRKYFGRVFNFNNLIQAEAVSDNLVGALSQNVDVSKIKNDAFGKKIDGILRDYLTNTDLLLTIKINSINNMIEYQFDLYETSQIQSKTFSMDSYKAALISGRMDYSSVVLGPNDNYEQKLREQLRSLFKESNKPPAVLFMSDGKTYDHCDSALCVQKMREDVSSVNLKAIVVDDDSEQSEMAYSWTINGIVMPTMRTEKLQKPNELNITERGGNDTIFLRVRDGVVQSKAYRFIVQRVKKPRRAGFSSSRFLVDDHYLPYYQIERQSSNFVVGDAGAFHFSFREKERQPELPVATGYISGGDFFSEYSLFNDQEKILSGVFSGEQKVNRERSDNCLLVMQKRVSDRSDSVVAFYYPIDIDPDKTYSVAMTSISGGVNFGAEERDISFIKARRTSMLLDVYSVSVDRFSSHENLNTLLFWSPSVGIRFRLFKKQSQIPTDLEFSTIFPVFSRSGFRKDNEDRDFEMERWIPKASLLMDAWNNSRMRASVGPSAMYFQRRVDSVDYKEGMLGVTGNFCLLMETIESSVHVNFLWGSRTEGTCSMIFQIGGTAALRLRKK